MDSERSAEAPGPTGGDARIGRLEDEVRALRERLDAQARTLGIIAVRIGVPPPGSPPSSAAPPRRRAPGDSPPAPPAPRPALEANLVGTWFARVGAVAILIGAGFAFKYAVDRGLIGPAARVAVGVLAGVAFVGWGEWAWRRGWPRFAQAVGGGGVALVYLSFWAGFELYGLLPQTATFALLLLASAGAGVLAVAHDSVALAALATFGGFLNPFLVGEGEPRPLPLYAYALVLDLGVLALAFVRRWRLLDGLAFAGTWIVFAAGFSPATAGVTLGFATAFFLLFGAVAVAGAAARREPSGPENLALVALNGAVYWGFTMAILGEGYGDARGPFTLGLGAAHLGAAALLGMARRIDRPLALTLTWVAVALVTTGVAIQLDGPWVGIAWAVEAALVALAGRRARLPELRFTAAAVFGLSLVNSLLAEGRLGAGYEPARLLFSTESGAFVLQIALLAVGAFLLSHGAEASERRASVVAAVTASALALVWLTFEARAALERAGASDEAFAFAVTALWGTYAAALLVAGVASRLRWARLMAVGLFGIVVAKMALLDLWLLPAGYRILAFTGLGVVLLLLSLMYHRFRDLVMREDEAPGAAG